MVQLKPHTEDLRTTVTVTNDPHGNNYKLNWNRDAVRLFFFFFLSPDYVLYSAASIDIIRIWAEIRDEFNEQTIGTIEKRIKQISH